MRNSKSALFTYNNIWNNNIFFKYKCGFFSSIMSLTKDRDLDRDPFSGSSNALIDI